MGGGGGRVRPPPHPPHPPYAHGALPDHLMLLLTVQVKCEMAYLFLLISFGQYGFFNPCLTGAGKRDLTHKKIKLKMKMKKTMASLDCVLGYYVSKDV